MKVTGFNGTNGNITIEANGYSYDAVIEINKDVHNRIVSIDSIEVYNSEKLNNIDYEGTYPQIDEDALALELENQVDWFEEESIHMEFMNELNSEY